uniref:Uncharacterized protein n=1 Tax=Tetranychus urticae TaxID=32264 RepID=T1K458_TETUR
MERNDVGNLVIVRYTYGYGSVDKKAWIYFEAFNLEDPPLMDFCDDEQQARELIEVFIFLCSVFRKHINSEVGELFPKLLAADNGYLRLSSVVIPMCNQM